jgi:transposase
MFRKKDPPAQQTLWIARSEIVSTPANTFYARLDQVLEDCDFPRQVRELCRPFYAEREEGGRPGIDPVVYFKMLLVGFFENIASERGIAARCADSLSIRQFLHYDLTETTPDHSSLSVIRNRLDADVFQQVFALVLSALKRHKLIKGKKLGLDASTLEANASMRSIQHRITGEAYQEYVERLAAAAGVDPKDKAAVRRFDKKRKDKKVSNDEWHNPHDEDARIGKTKQGPTKLIYKVEHAVDLQTGAIVDADVLPGDQGDTADLAERLWQIEARMNEALGNEADEATIESATMDKGYYKVEELARIQQSGIKTVVADPIDNRNLEKLSTDHRKAVQAARRSSKAKYGKALTRKRGMYVERSFEHVLDCGGARKTTLRGRETIKKRYVIQAMGCNLSLLMRKLIGVGTVKQALALASVFVMWLMAIMACLVLSVMAWAKGATKRADIALVGSLTNRRRVPASSLTLSPRIVLQAG